MYFRPSDCKTVELSASQMKVIVIWVCNQTCVRKCIEKGLFDQNVNVFFNKSSTADVKDVTLLLPLTHYYK